MRKHRMPFEALAIFRRSVKLRIECVEILAVKAILRDGERFAETLEMHDFPLTQIADRIADFLIVNQTEDVVIGSACLLFCCHILDKIGDDVSLALELAGVERNAGCRSRPQCSGMIDVIPIEAGGFDVVYRKIFCKLVNDSADDLHVCEFVRTTVIEIKVLKLNMGS